MQGLALVAPTWFPVAVTPHELAARGLAESARGITRGSWFDRLGLIAASARLAQEMLAHPLALRNDVTAISQEGVADLESVLDLGINVSVTAGIYDELCQVTGIRGVVESLPDRYYVDYREVPSDHFSYFLSPKPLRVVADQVAHLAAEGGRPEGQLAVRSAGFRRSISDPPSPPDVTAVARRLRWLVLPLHVDDCRFGVSLRCPQGNAEKPHRPQLDRRVMVDSTAPAVTLGGWMVADWQLVRYARRRALVLRQAYRAGVSPSAMSAGRQGGRAGPGASRGVRRRRAVAVGGPGRPVRG